MQKLHQIEFNPKDRLGKGSHGSVFSGKFDGRQIAVKRIQLIDTDEREEEALQRLNHLNVVKLFHVENHEAFK